MPLFRLLCSLWLCAFLVPASAEDWPSFRGPTGMGTTTTRDLPLTWDGATGANVAWKVPLPATLAEGAPDHNQSSPIIHGNRILVTSAYWTGKKSDAAEYPQHHVTCYQLTDGKQLWDTVIEPGGWKLNDLRGGYAAPTPVTDGKLVYVVFGSSVLAAVDFEGKLVWRKEIPDFKDFDVALASSPILHRGQLLFLADRNGGKSTLNAFDPATGNELWSQKRTGNFTHTTPVIVEHEGQPQMLVASAKELEGLNPTNGERIWWCKMSGDVTSPVYHAGRVYSDSGRGGKGIFVAAGKGDVSENIAWEVPQIPEGLSSPAIAGDFLYRLHTPGVIKCIRLSDGKVVYEKRLNGVSAASSPIVTPDNRVYFASAGKTYVIQSGPEYELLATNDLGDSNAASAAVSQGRMILKGQKHLFSVMQMQPAANNAKP